MRMPALQSNCGRARSCAQHPAAALNSTLIFYPLARDLYVLADDKGR
jgi:hypothetical protein